MTEAPRRGQISSMKNMDNKDKKKLVWILWLVGAPLIFVLDTITAIDVTVSVLYVILMVLITRAGTKTQILISGAYFGALTVISYILSPSAFHPSVDELSNLGLSSVTILATTYLGAKLVSVEADSHRMRSRASQISRSASLSELALAVSHEVNQPLAATVANAGAAARWLDKTPPQLEEAKVAILAARSSAERAGEIINGLRRLASRNSPHLEACDLVGLLKETVELVLPEAIERTIFFETRLLDPIPLIRADRVLLQQAFLNVLMNSIEAMEKVSPHQRIIVISAVAHRSRVHVEIADNGSGVTREDINRLFEPFYTTKARGVGIGLALTRSIIEAHAGTVAAHPGTPSGLVVEFALVVNEE